MNIFVLQPPFEQVNTLQKGETQVKLRVLLACIFLICLRHWSACFSPAMIQKYSSCCCQYGGGKDCKMDPYGIAAVGEVFWCKSSPEVEQHMKQDRQVNAFALKAYIAAEYSYDKSISALNHIAMESAEQKCLQQVSCEKGHCFCGIFQCDASKDQFFADGSNQDGVKGEKRGDISKSNVFHQIIISLIPCRIYSGKERHQISG